MLLNNNTDSILQQVGENISNLAIESIRYNPERTLSDEVKTQLIKTAISVFDRQQNLIYKRHEWIIEIERTKLKCNKLLIFLNQAHYEGKIHLSEFLNLEIQIKDQIKRLNEASNKIELKNRRIIN
jgi:hypothetical protein